MITNMEQAVRNGDNCQLFQFLKQSSRRTSSVSETLLDKPGKQIANLNECPKSWVQHFLNLLNHQLLASQFLLPDHDLSTYLCKCDLHPSVAEITLVIKNLKNNKASRENNILVKADPELAIHSVHCLIKHI